jgi:heat shock protein HtpX
MEMCIDNPREGFSNLFDTHPSVERRVAALVQFAGGHDPGPLELPQEPPAESQDQTPQQYPADGTPPGPWSSAAEPPDAPPKPFLPSEPPVTLGGQNPPGPWGNRQG